MTDHICSDHLHCSLDHQPSVNRLLWELGHFDEVEDGFSVHHPAYEEVETLGELDYLRCKAVESWQGFRPWLNRDGAFGEVSHMASVQEIGLRCGCPDVMRRPAGIAEWPPACQDEVTTSFDSRGMRYEFGERMPGDVWREANEKWNEVCGVVLSTVTVAEDARIRAIMGSMGSGTLAWSYLADGSCASRLRQEYNRSRTWDLHSFLWVNAHEKGHALGLGHTGERGNIMQPYYSPGLSALGPWEIAQVVKRYGPPVAPEPPTPPQPPVPPTPPGEWRIVGGSGSIVVSDGVTERRLPVDHSHRGIVDV